MSEVAQGAAGNSIVPVRATDLPALLALNNDHAAELSLLELAGLERLIANAAVALQSADATAFVVAFDEVAHYDSPNFLWFQARFDRFLYVDRVVVAKAARGRGLARALYESVFAEADSRKSRRIVCEINLNPPNPDSVRFHEALNFRQLGSARLDGGAKTVGYYERSV